MTGAVTQAALELRAFVAGCAALGELRRVTAEVDPYLEIAAITDRVSKAGGPALFFEKVRGHDVPVLTNLFGTPARAARAIGAVDAASAALRFAGLLAAAGSGSGAQRLARICADPAWSLEPTGTFSGVAGMLADLPALQSWPGDGGRHLTLPLVVTRDPESARLNCGMYRVQLLGDDQAAIRWRPESDAARHHAAWRRRGAAMPVAIVLGGPPALTWAAGAPLPTEIDELAFAGLIAGAPLPLTGAQTCDLPLPAAAEAVLEGWVEPEATALEGPFGNHTGYYAPAGPAPLFRLARLTRRADMLSPATVVGPPPMEDCHLAQLTARLWLPLLRCDFPELVDLAMPREGVFHGCALLAVRREAGFDGRALLRALWQTPLLRRARLLLLLDAETDVHDPALAFWRALNQCDPGRDLLFEDGRLGLDASSVGPGPRVAHDAALQQLVARRWREYGLEE